VVSGQSDLREHSICPRGWNRCSHPRNDLYKYGSASSCHTDGYISFRLTSTIATADITLVRIVARVRPTRNTARTILLGASGRIVVRAAGAVGTVATAGGAVIRARVIDWVRGIIAGVSVRTLGVPRSKAGLARGARLVADVVYTRAGGRGGRCRVSSRGWTAVAGPVIRAGVEAVVFVPREVTVDVAPRTQGVSVAKAVGARPRAALLEVAGQEESMWQGGGGEPGAALSEGLSDRISRLLG
jgi:hypothetical protein